MKAETGLSVVQAHPWEAHGTQKQECGNTGAGPPGAALGDGQTRLVLVQPPLGHRQRADTPEDHQHCLTWLPPTTPSNADNVRKKSMQSVSTYRFIFCGVGGR